MSEEKIREVKYTYDVGTIPFIVSGSNNQKDFPKEIAKQSKIKKKASFGNVLGIYQQRVFASEKQRKADEEIEKIINLSFGKDSILHRKLNNQLIMIGYDPNLLNVGFTSDQIVYLVSDVTMRTRTYPANLMPNVYNKDIDLINKVIMETSKGLEKIIDGFQGELLDKEFAKINFKNHKINNISKVRDLYKKVNKYGLDQSEYIVIKNNLPEEIFLGMIFEHFALQGFSETTKKFN